MIAASGREWYRPLDAALLRSSVGTAQAVPAWPGVDIAEDVEQWYAWVRQVWANDEIAEAIAVASPALAGRLEAVCDGQPPDPGQLGRMVRSLGRYLVRMRGRATPFGLLAGVAPLRIGAATVRTGLDRRWVRADAQWVASVVDKLESYSGLRCRLRVVVNDFTMVRGDRLVVTWQPHASRLGGRAPVEVSLRHTRAVRTLLHAAQAPVSVEELLGRLASGFPTIEPPAADALVAQLLRHGVLVSNLRPPSTTVDGLGHVLEVLDGVDGAVAAQLAATVDELRAIHAGLAGSERKREKSRLAGGDQHPVVSRMRAVSDSVAQPLMVDLRLGNTVAVPEPVTVEAAAAAGALQRLSASPGGVAGWRDYHARFLRRYGFGAVVSVAQMVDPTAGLGLPFHYTDPDPDSTAETWTRRDERLLVLAQQAALDQSHEVVLDDTTIDALAGEEAANLRPVPHLDLCVEVRAASSAALDAGEFTLVVTGIGQSAVATSGRFLHLLSEQEHQRAITQYAALPTAVSGALVAQVSFPPHHPRLENVTRVPQVLPTVITMGEHNADDDHHLRLDDLAVTADNDRLYVVSVLRRQVVEPVLACAAARHTMPPVARLLVEIPHATSVMAALFDWGAARCLPFRPRLRYQRSILALAKWRIPNGLLPGVAASQSEWDRAIAALRRQRRLPNHVFVGDGDRKLRLNLDEQADLTLLRSHLAHAAGPTTFTEAPSAADHEWLRGRAHELLIPMASTAPPAPAPAVLTRPGLLPLISHKHARMPGSPVLFAKLYGHPDGFDTILIEHLPTLLDGWDEPPLWWFLRFRDPAPHLRLRFRTPGYGLAAARIGAWAADLRRSGLVGDLTLDTDRPEVGRYGDGEALDAAEELFAADAAAALAQLTARSASGKVDPYAVTAVSLTDLAGVLLGSRPAGMHWLIEHQEYSAREGFRDRSVLRQAVALAGLDTDTPSIETVPGGEGIASAWRSRRRAATIYAHRLAEHGAQVTPGSVAASVLHLHHIRAHGVEPELEGRTYRLARQVALAYAARHRPLRDAVS